MTIAVENPGECPVRHTYEEIHWCAGRGSNRMPCSSPMFFPDKCPLQSRTIVIEKAEEDEGRGTRDEAEDET